jgi:archaemetzincin
MNRIELIRMGDVDENLLAGLARRLEAHLRVDCSIHRKTIDAALTFHPERQQYHSTETLEMVGRIGSADGRLRLCVTGVDLYIPILTFVFGEAEVEGHRAVVSYHRLRQEFYGLDADRDLLADRLLKEAIHEIGHGLGLTHCDDYECVMSASHSVEWIDLKTALLCRECDARLHRSFRAE